MPCCHAKCGWNIWESAQAKAERIVAEELSRLAWTKTELAARRKSDPAKSAIAARLRKKTTLSLKAIASRVHLAQAKAPTQTCTSGYALGRRRIHPRGGSEYPGAFLWVETCHG